MKFRIPRSSERRPMSVTVKSHVRSRRVVVELLDISEGGCKIRGSSGFAALGDRVTMKINGINTPLGTVAWVNDDIAGIAFEGQLHPAMLDFLCNSSAAEPRR